MVPTPGVEPVEPFAKGRLGVLLGIVAVLLIAANVGTILSATLVNDHPALLLALSARNRHLLLTVAAGIGVFPYSAISAARLAAAAIPLFLLGRWYGDQGLRWLERQAGGMPASVRWVEKAFDRASLPILFLMPGSNLVCLLAGARRISVRTFLVVVAIGVLVRLAFFWVLGKALQEPLERLLDWIARYQWWLAGGFFALTMFQSVRRANAAAREAAATDEESG